jgi:hypothetical protein
MIIADVTDGSNLQRKKGGKKKRKKWCDGKRKPFKIYITGSSCGRIPWI